MRYINQNDPAQTTTNSPRFSHINSTSDRIYIADLRKSQSKRSMMNMTVACPESMLPSNSFELLQNNNDSFYDGNVYTYEMMETDGDDCHKVDFDDEHEIVTDSVVHELHLSISNEDSIYNTNGGNVNNMVPSENNLHHLSLTTTATMRPISKAPASNNNNKSNMGRIFNLPNYLLTNINYKVNLAQPQSRSFDYSNIYESNV